MCEKWFWAEELRWRKFIGTLRRRMSRFKNRQVAGVVYIALGLNFSPNICRFCSWWTLQKNVWNPKAVRLAVTKSIQRRVLQAASWEGIQICCHTALPNFPTISREKISLDRIPIFWFTLSFGEFESGNRYYNHKRKKEKKYRLYKWCRLLAMEEKMRSTQFKTFTVCNVLFLTLSDTRTY